MSPPLPLPVPGPVSPGQICNPNNISDADQATAKSENLACQLTTERTFYQIPGQFLNALMGDIILSPGADTSGQLIGALLRALKPPQYHSHSGLMTANFEQITHCTAAAERVAKHSETIGPIPTQLTARTLQYAWPGSITQSIDEATIGGTPWRDPEFPADTYSLVNFTPVDVDLLDGTTFVLVPPMVVKPLPENEGTARPQLRKAASIALNKGATVDQDGTQTKPAGCYYSFYGYSKPELAAGFADGAPPDAGWAAGLSPAVCSSFIWLSMKEAGLPLVTTNQYEVLSDFSTQAISEGAAVGSQTLDGLTFYSENERIAAGSVLYTEMVNQVTNAEGIFAGVPGLGATIASNIADQMCNMFAFGDPNMVGISDWQQPGDANAVSPDNLRFWNPSYFGYTEPLQYLGPHVEEYTVSRWVQVQTFGTISGTVTLDGIPVVNAYVQLYAGMSAMTDAGGNYTLINVPTGPYNIKASVTQSGFYYSNGDYGQPLNLTGPSLVFNIAFQITAADYRTLAFTGCNVSCDHGDGNPGHAHGIQTQSYPDQSITLAPNHLVNNCSYFYNYDDGSYFNVLYNVTASLASDLSANVEIEAILYPAGSNQPQSAPTTFSINVPAESAVGFTISIETSGGAFVWSWHNGPSTLTGSVSNFQTP